jgi:uncharacterized protein
MKVLHGSAAWVLAVAAAVLLVARGECAETPQLNSTAVNRGVVELVTDRSTDISVRMAEEVAGIVDDGATRRVVAVVGKGSFQNITDLKFLRGIDLAIIPVDALAYARERRMFPGIEANLTYVAKLYSQELHLLARSDIKRVADLSGQTVNVDVQGSSVAFTSERVFELLNIRFKPAYDSPEVALEKLRKGEIAAVALLAAKPASFLQLLPAAKPGDGLRLLSIPLNQRVIGTYAPARITSADYPGLVSSDQPVETIAVGSVLMAADLRNISERHRNVANFVYALFTGFDRLLAPGRHPKWREVNIAAEFPGWIRHPAAQEWLQRNSAIAAVPSRDSLQTLFSRFIDERRQASGGAPMSVGEKDALFQQFQNWRRGQAQ